MSVLYNEIDPYAAEWLRNLIAAGHIAAGDVDERDIRDLTPEYVGRYTQFHAFAGIGLWSYALRRAGWPDNRPIWTASCPCQPFSAAGAGRGFADERHLWPHFFHLVEQCHPSTIFGEQVASKDGLGWLDLVLSDLEGASYAVGAIDLCSAGFGAPHIRQRLRFAARDLRAETAPSTGKLADLFGPGLQVRSLPDERRGTLRDKGSSAAEDCLLGSLAHGDGERRDTRQFGGAQKGHSWRIELDRYGDPRRLAHGDDAFRGPDAPSWDHVDGPDARRPEGPGDAEGRSCADGLDDAGRIELRRGPEHGGDSREAEAARRGTREQRVRSDDSPSGATERLGHADGERQDSIRGFRSGSATEPDRKREAEQLGDGDGHGRGKGQSAAASTRQGHPLAPDGGVSHRLGDPDIFVQGDGDLQRGGELGWSGQDQGTGAAVRMPGPTNGFWRAADWLYCRDGVWRPVEPATFPLAHGYPARVGKLRAYGNAINPEAESAFIAAFLDAEADGLDHDLEVDRLLG